MNRPLITITITNKSFWFQNGVMFCKLRLKSSTIVIKQIGSILMRSFKTLLFHNILSNYSVNILIHSSYPNHIQINISFSIQNLNSCSQTSTALFINPSIGNLLKTGKSLKYFKISSLQSNSSRTAKLSSSAALNQMQTKNNHIQNSFAN